MDEASADVEREKAKRPQDEQNDSQCPKHDEYPRLVVSPSYAARARLGAHAQQSYRTPPSARSRRSREPKAKRVLRIGGRIECGRVRDVSITHGGEAREHVRRHAGVEDVLNGHAPRVQRITDE
jgi:hypothetical protein